MNTPLSDTQAKFWSGHQQDPQQPIYNMAWRFDLCFALDVQVFERALNDVIAASDILRATFALVDGQPAQRAAPDMPQALAVTDLSSEHEPELVLTKTMSDWAQEPFDLERSTIRNHLVRLTETHWVWFLCQHHIACDAQSSALLFQAVSDRYAELSLNAAAAMPELRSFFDSAVCQAQSVPQSFGAPPVPATRPYGARGGAAPVSSRVAIPLAVETAAALENAFSEPQFRMLTPDLSRLAVLMTAYFTYLHRVTGDEDITIGVPAHNRLSQADRATLGPFLEVLPVTVSFSAQDRVSDIHQKVKEALGQFLRTARPGTAATVDTRRISAVLNFIQANFGDFACHPARHEWLHSGAHDAAHAMRLHVTDFTGDAPMLSVDVAQDVLEKTDAGTVAEHFAKTLDVVLHASETLVAAVPLTAQLTDLAISIGAEETCDFDTDVLGLIQKQAVAAPHKVALRDGDATLTYAALEARSDAVAAHILSRNIPAGSSIAVNMRRSVECVVALLGIWKAGCTFVPIAASTPFGRVQQILKGAQAAAVFVDPDARFDYGCPALKLGDISDADQSFQPIPPSEAAYVLFTSGSTGVPKGVAVSHAAFSRYIQWAAASFGAEGDGGYAFFSSISFDLTLTSIFAPLVSGGTVSVYPETSDPDFAVLDVFRDDAVDVVKLTPSHAALVCQAGLRIERIRTLVLGGENLSRSLCLRLLEGVSPNLRLINEYGPTEAVVGAMEHVFDPEQDASASVQIGQAAPGVTISVRDAALQPCPHGVAGEIVISGRLAEGYANDPDLTAQKFVADPLDKTTKVYRTGDLGRLHKDGSFEYLGRADQQIKLGGIRLELAEIERAASAAPGVEAVHVGFASPQNVQQKTTQHCVRCGLSETYPDAEIGSDGLCSICAQFDSYKDKAQAYFRPEPELAQQIAAATQKSTGDYDAIMLLSGGKDSTYAAYRLADYNLRVLAVTLDNGYISDGAKTNIARVVDHLGWDHRYLSTSKMNEIFVDSLNMHANVCQGCFKAIYTLALRTAVSEGVAMIVTGLSRGQFFETRLTPELFRDSTPTCTELDQMVSRARKTYHAENDTFSRLMQTDDLKDGRVLDQVEILDIYRYIDVPVADIYAFLDSETAWQRPGDTGRSTNCLINDVGIHVHKSRTGFHNYALPYSWDVRMGHKTRAQAMDELDDEIDVARVEEILDEIGFDGPVSAEPELTVFVAGAEAREADVWGALKGQLPRGMLPKHVVSLDALPLTPNGKVDTGRLPVPRKALRNDADTALEMPETDMERLLAGMMTTVLGTAEIGVSQDFFDLGIDSLAAIKVAMHANEQGIALPTTALFEHRSLRALAKYAEGLVHIEDDVDLSDALLDLDADDLASIAQALT